MPSEHVLAPAPGGEDLAESARRKRPHRALVMRGASLLLLLTVGCSQVVPSAAPRQRGTERPSGTAVASAGRETKAPPTVATPQVEAQREAPVEELSPVVEPPPAATTLDRAAASTQAPVAAAPAPAPK